MDLTAMFDRLFICMGYCPNCFANGNICKVYRPKADRSEWISDKYITYKGEHFSGFCGGNKDIMSCGWSTQEGEPISNEEMKEVQQSSKQEPKKEIDPELPF